MARHQVTPETSPVKPEIAIPAQGATVAASLRLIGLHRAFAMRQGICDRCGRQMARSRVIEAWRDSECLYAICVDCMGRQGIEIHATPGGIEIVEAKGGREVCVRPYTQAIPLRHILHTPRTPEQR